VLKLKLCNENDLRNKSANRWIEGVFMCRVAVQKSISRHLLSTACSGASAGESGQDLYIHTRLYWRGS